MKTFGIFLKSPAYGSCKTLSYKERSNKNKIILEGVKATGVKLKPYYSEIDAQHVINNNLAEWKDSLEVNEYCHL